ncbi:MAG: MFS transporter [Dehalococcoidales bacterium]|nr:MFS transporter [Dehalococcoidales bacterium]
MIKKFNPRYKWYILTLAGLTYAIIAGASRMCMPVLFKQIADELKLSVTAVGTVWGMDPLAGVFIGLPSGMLADRFGIKRSLTILCILAGVFGALRGVSDNFFSLAFIMFLFGLMAAAAPSIVPKATAVWFGGKRLALANGILIVAWSLGSMVATQFSATVFSPSLGSWRGVMFLFGGISIALGLLWFFTGREPDKTENPELSTDKIPFRQALSHISRIKEVWIIGLVTFFNWGASMGFMGYLPLYLRNIGWSPASADSVITVSSAMMLLGSIPMVLLSDRLKSRWGVLMVSVTALAVSLVLLPYVNTLGVWLVIIIGNFLRSGSSSLFNVMLLENKNIGSTYGGTAIGLASTISMVGAFVAPPLGNSLADMNKGWPFLLWAGLASLSIPLMFFIREKPALSTSSSV